MSRGFSLIELLVVMSIISILAMLLVPAVNMVRAQAAGIKCISIARQYGLAHEGFAADKEGTIPNSIIFHEELAPYLEQVSSFDNPATRRLLECPGWRQSPYRRSLVQAAQQGDATAQWILGSAIGYGAPIWYPDLDPSPSLPNWPNRVNFKDWNPLGAILLARVTFPSYRLLVGDAYGYAIWDTTADSSTNFGDHERHGGKATVLFVDQHVGRLDRLGVIAGIDHPWDHIE